MWALLGLALVAGALIHYWWWIIVAVVIWTAISTYRLAVAEIASEQVARQVEHARLIAQANQQHAWTLSGDPRGTFGVDYADIQKGHKP